MAFQIFTKQNRLSFYERLLEIESKSKNLLLIQDFPSAIFRSESFDRKRAEMRFWNFNNGFNKYLSITEKRRTNFRKRLFKGEICIIHVYNRHDFRRILEGKQIADYPLFMTKDEGVFQTKKIKESLEIFATFGLRLTSRKVGLRGVISRDTHEVLLQQPVEDQILEGKYWQGERETEEFEKYLAEMSRNEKFKLDSQKREERARIIRWLRLLIKEDDNASAIDELKDVLSGNLKDLLIKALKLENIKSEEVKLLYFGMNSEIYPNTLHLLTFEPADLLEVYAHLPYVQKKLYYKGYVNDILGFQPEDETAISAKAFKDNVWMYSSDASETSGYPVIDNILGIHSTLYIPLKIEGNEAGGILLLTATNHYPKESRLSKESLLLKPSLLFTEGSPCRKLESAINLINSQELEKYQTILFNTLQEYVKCYNRIVRRFEFELIFHHLNIAIEEPSNLIAMHLNADVFEKILRFNSYFESVQEKYLKKHGVFRELIEILEAFEHALMLSQEGYRNHAAHMFNVLCLGNVFLSNKNIKKMCVKYLKKLIGNHDELAEKAVYIILDYFWKNNKESGLIRFIKESLQEDNGKGETFWSILAHLVWFIIATCHDIARAVEKSTKNIKSQYSALLGSEIVGRHADPLSQEIIDRKLKFIKEWKDATWKPAIHAKLFPFEQRKSIEDYNIHRFPDDHAHIGALCVWLQLSKILEDLTLDDEQINIYKQLMFCCAWPIFFHHLPKYREEHDKAKFSFEAYPFLGILVLSDALQIWGRESATLKDEETTSSDFGYDFDLYRPLISKIDKINGDDQIDILFATRKPNEDAEDAKIVEERQKRHLDVLYNDMKNVAELIDISTPIIRIGVSDKPPVIL